MNNTRHTLHLPEKSEDTFAHGGIPFVFPGLTGVGCLFSTVVNGNMALSPDLDADGRNAATQNRRALLESLRLDGWVELKQVHGNHVVVEPGATPPPEASTLEGDGSCTSRKRLALVIKTADCQPILLTDLQGSAIAALHVGWRGNALNFPASGLRRFCETYGLSAQDVLAVRGPSLGPGAAEFVNFSQEWPPEFLPWFRKESRTMDLWTLTKHQLVHAGMRPEHIFSLDFCTRSLPEMFFSYRLGHAGRQASMIWLR